MTGPVLEQYLDADERQELQRLRNQRQPIREAMERLGVPVVSLLAFVAAERIAYARLHGLHPRFSDLDKVNDPASVRPGFTGTRQRVRFQSLHPDLLDDVQAETALRELYEYRPVKVAAAAAGVDVEVLNAYRRRYREHVRNCLSTCVPNEQRSGMIVSCTPHQNPLPSAATGTSTSTSS